MKIGKALSICAVAGLTATALVVVPAAPGAPHEHEHADPAESLSPELRALLREEMLLITEGMGVLAESISLGDWEATVKTATKVQHSFILKQKLGEDDVEELHAKLPAGFLRMDHRFHGTAGKLAQAAHDSDAELATYYYARLLEGCVSCHGQYAPKRFPGLAEHAGQTAPDHGHDDHEGHDDQGDDGHDAHSGH